MICAADDMQARIDRVRRMERSFDCVRTALDDEPDCTNWDSGVRDMLRELTQYFESGQWLADYTCDEQGQFPTNLKRGVLSQDGLYDLLCRIEE